VIIGTEPHEFGALDGFIAKRALQAHQHPGRDGLLVRVPYHGVLSVDILMSYERVTRINAFGRHH
jgi:hypothetical protein